MAFLIFFQKIQKKSLKNKNKPQTDTWHVD